MNHLQKLARALPIFAVLAGCAPKTAAPPAIPQTVAPFPSDDLGRTVALKAPAQRVIVIGPGAIETVYALGAQKQLVGRDGYAVIPPAAKSVAVAGDYQGPNVEQSIALRPDLIIVQGETYDEARAENWQGKIGVPVAILRPTSLQKVRDDIEKIGAWLGKRDGAKKLAATLNFPAPPANGPTAFIEIGRSPLYSAGPDTLVGDVLKAAGLRNAAQIKGYAPYNIETLIANQPDFYLATSDKPKEQVLSELRKSPTLSKLKCVQTGRVIVMEGDLILRPGPRLKQGIEKLKEQAVGTGVRGLKFLQIIAPDFGE